MAAQNAVTEPYLASLPLRQHFTDRLTALWNYPRVSLPVTEGGRLFYAKNSGLQRQAPIYHARLADGAATPGDRPQHDLRRRLHLGGAARAFPDAALFAYALSKGGADWQTIKVRDIADR